MTVIDCNRERALAKLAMKCVNKEELASLTSYYGDEPHLRWNLEAVAAEYWTPDSDSRTLKCEVFPYWLDREKFDAGLDEFWDWLRVQQSLIASVVHETCRQLEKYNVPAYRIEAPYAWTQVLKCPTTSIFGLRTEFMSRGNASPGCVFSDDKFGRFVVIEWERAK